MRPVASTVWSDAAPGRTSPWTRSRSSGRAAAGIGSLTNRAASVAVGVTHHAAARDLFGLRRHHKRCIIPRFGRLGLEPQGKTDRGGQVRPDAGVVEQIGELVVS